MPVFTETRNTVRLQIGRDAGRLVQPGTFSVTVGTPTFVRLEDLFLRDADLGRGLYLYIPSGGGSGQARTVISATAGVQGTGSILYPHLNFTPAPSTDAVVELWKGVDPRVVNGFIDDAIRAAAKKSLEHHEDYAIQLDDALRHTGSFERWSSGTTSLPDGWSTSSGSPTVGQERNLVYAGKYTLSLSGTVFVIESGNIANYPALAGKTITAYAKIYTVDASRWRINIADGVATSNSPFHDGSGGWDGNSGDVISVEHTVAGSPSKLTVQIELATGSATTAYIGKIWLDIGSHIYEYRLPTHSTTIQSFGAISEVWLEDLSTPNTYTVRVPPEYWTVDTSRTVPILQFRRGVIDPLLKPGRTVRLVGQAEPRLPSSDTANLDVDPEYVKLAAAYRVLDANPWDEQDRAKRDRWAAEANRMLQEITTPIYPDSVMVE